ncbi:MAG: hypothetical protein PVG30_05700 [Gammaproteobacteria bacterium]|jgi:hypothetical protein
MLTKLYSHSPRQQVQAILVNVSEVLKKMLKNGSPYRQYIYGSKYKYKHQIYPESESLLIKTQRKLGSEFCDTEDHDFFTMCNLDLQIAKKANLGNCGAHSRITVLLLAGYMLFKEKQHAIHSVETVETKDGASDHMFVVLNRPDGFKWCEFEPSLKMLKDKRFKDIFIYDPLFHVFWTPHELISKAKATFGSSFDHYLSNASYDMAINHFHNKIHFEWGMLIYQLASLRYMSNVSDNRCDLRISKESISKESNIKKLIKSFNLRKHIDLVCKDSITTTHEKRLCLPNAKMPQNDFDKFLVKSMDNPDLGKKITDELEEKIVKKIIVEFDNLLKLAIYAPDVFKHLLTVGGNQLTETFLPGSKVRRMMVSEKILSGLIIDIDKFFVLHKQAPAAAALLLEKRFEVIVVRINNFEQLEKLLNLRCAHNIPINNSAKMFRLQPFVNAVWKVVNKNNIKTLDEKFPKVVNLLCDWFHKSKEELTKLVMVKQDDNVNFKPKILSS